MAARPEPMANVTEMVVFTSMPISCAAPLSSETARMALPSFVLLMNVVSRIMMTTHTTIVRIVMYETVRPPTSIDSFGMIELNTFGFDDQNSSARFCSRYDTPIAVMSTARDGAARSGLYASFSITMPRQVHTSMARITLMNGFSP